MNRILEKRIVPVAVLDNADDAAPLAEALLAGGLDIIEVTFRTAAAESAIRSIVARHPQMLVGAGTLLAAQQVQRARDAGARFGVAPGLNEAVVNEARACGLPFVPGVATASEVEQALALECRLLKLYPADLLGGVKFLAALAGPYGHTGVRFIPLGGINAANAANYLALPIVAAVGGTWLVDRALIVAHDWPAITQRTREALALVRAAAGGPVKS